MTEKIKLYDDSKCTACRGCQLACKQWNDLKAGQTKNTGTYQNPPSLQPNTYMIIHYQDYVNPQGDVKWLFRKEACMHCTDAACVTVCPSGALYYNKEFKIVGLNRQICIGCKECVTACPFEVPRYDSKTDKVYKCDMCESRISNGLEPACVKACPTGALKWGDKEAILNVAAKRTQELGAVATTYGDKFVGGTHFMYVLKEQPDIYDGIKKNPKVPLSVTLWKGWLKPLSLLAAGGVVGGSLLHYILHGPKRPDPEEVIEEEETTEEKEAREILEKLDGQTEEEKAKVAADTKEKEKAEAKLKSDEEEKTRLAEEEKNKKDQDEKT